MFVHKDANFFFNINRDDFSTECDCSAKLIILLKLKGGKMPFYVYMNIQNFHPKKISCHLLSSGSLHTVLPAFLRVRIISLP